ncbi:MAG: alpha/beta hydrolase [Anaerolineae bacterium]|nr:alpha/beta hydrolase [Anaerolineae bacterium]
MTASPLYKTPAGEQAVMALYDRALENWRVPYDSQHVPTRHGDTFVLSSGDAAAPPLVLLHGAGTNSAIWIEDVPTYCQTYRVYAVDLLGEAGKSAPNRPAWASPAYAEWLADVFDALGIEQAALIGISQGGWTALKYATTHAARVSRLVLLTPGGIVPDKLSFLLRAIPYSMMGKAGSRRMARLVYGSEPIPAGVDEVMDVVTRNFKSRMGVLPIFADEELRRLTMPTLLLVGAEDALRDATKIGARLGSLLPKLTAVTIPRAGHALLNTPPYILPFLAGN